MPHLRPLLSQLTRAIGRHSAEVELKWMKGTLDNPPSGIRQSCRSLEEMVARRAAGEPLQYILGSQPFGPLELAVRPPVLIPRPETEDWTMRLAETLTPSPSRPAKILDLCTGTGCIPLLLCHLWPAGSIHATAIDISPDAIQLAKENAVLCGITAYGDASTQPLTTPQAKNTFMPILADLLHPEFITQARLEPPYDLITSNPPYIPQAEYDALPASVKDYEDIQALLGDSPSPHASGAPAEDRTKGLTFYHRIAALVGGHGLLRAGGTLALEVGAGQAPAVAAIVQAKAGVDKIDVWKDPWGKERVVVARR
ncbi:S-adenosyl-L-methionine-dependent methyltransferase [Lentinus tigrinus ALCF2SS1-6]|uniref:S-adenosyl-L-methionine-dependent methyltransferase n=1 Tax=Lentinus tigrinus ALCF2SS1-6 TaxID=1328759 RepID=A0A5C2S7Y9_9APHY|nr:S-adenosyl-L-methionine-dependent methyltransferase [Lentinus tigrinus ALCF2SS1-6]